MRASSKWTCRWLRHLGALLGMLAILGPIGFGLAGAALAGQRDNGSGLTLIALCTPEGIRWVDFGADADSETSGDSEPKPDNELPGLLDCPLCQFAKGLLVLPAPPFAMSHGLGDASALPRPNLAPIAAAPGVWSRFASRAPPTHL